VGARYVNINVRWADGMMKRMENADFEARVFDYWEGSGR
jgi:hypothetical protein